MHSGLDTAISPLTIIISRLLGLVPLLLAALLLYCWLVVR